MGNNPSYYSGDNKPVERVTWQNANDFCKKAGGFLPTEAQWEFAARGGNNSMGDTYSGSNNLNEVGWYSRNSNSQTQPVGQKKPNELGIYDMSGNVWEWCSDLYQSGGSDRVLRGGSWSISEEYCRVSYRYFIDPGLNYDYLGFRAAFPRN
jgi:formylglycine-generating enzyme required for sulfatase activity